MKGCPHSLEWGKASRVLKSLGNNDSRQVGHFHGVSGVQAGISSPSTSSFSGVQHTVRSAEEKLVIASTRPIVDSRGDCGGTSKRFVGLYSNLCTVPKPNGDVRPILDLKSLNRYQNVRYFRMESVNSVVASLQVGDFLASKNIKECILACANFPTSSVVSALRDKRSSLSICGSALPTCNSTSSVHESSQWISVFR